VLIDAYACYQYSSTKYMVISVKELLYVEIILIICFVIALGTKGPEGWKLKYKQKYSDYMSAWGCWCAGERSPEDTVFV